MRNDSNQYDYQLCTINKVCESKDTNYKITFTYLWLERSKVPRTPGNLREKNINLEIICTKLQNNFDLLTTYLIKSSEILS